MAEENNAMRLILCGTAGYEAEHTARMFFRMQRADCPPPDGDYLLVSAKPYAFLALLRRGGVTRWQALPADPDVDLPSREYALCKMLYQFLQQQTGIRPPWGMMTGVRPVRIIHDMRAAGATEQQIEDRFIGHFDCTRQRFDMAKRIADLQRPILEAARPMDCSLYAGIPFCPSRCSYCSFVSRTVGDKATRALVQPLSLIHISEPTRPY